jgi:hypothetical protein
MKFLQKFLIIMVMINQASCASDIIPRSFLKRRYDPCHESLTSENEWKWCFRYCKKYKIFRDENSDNCKSWEVDILDYRIKKDRDKLRRFILKHESEI